MGKPFKQREFGKFITVSTDKTMSNWFARVNWGCSGPQNVYQTKLFIKNLQRATEFCDKLTGKK